MTKKYLNYQKFIIISSIKNYKDKNKNFDFLFKKIEPLSN